MISRKPSSQGDVRFALIDLENEDIS